jgi:PTS system nitrogen regulatory IIA component
VSKSATARVRRSLDPPSPLDLLTTRELAAYLRLNERTILKLASHGELPGVRLGNQWRFRRAVIDTWLDDQMLGVRRRAPGDDPPAPPTFEFPDGFGERNVIARVRGHTKTHVLGELCTKAGELDLVRDRTWFLGAVLERENVLSSAVGRGIAFPHTLQRHPEQIRAPFVIVGRSPEGVDFGAADGQPVELIVLLGLRYQELHLPWLSLLSRLLKDDATRSEIMKAKGPRQIRRLLIERVEAESR